MSLKSPLNKTQEKRYDKVCEQIRKKLGSFERISHVAHTCTGDRWASETIRRWFISRTIPTDFCFVLYELMGLDFEIFDLLPWLKSFFK